MAKITIYVPDELKAEMDAAPKEPQINWSGLAQEAFELECRRIANRKKGAGKMEAVIQRLRKSKERLINEDKVAGDAAGRRWASTKASYGELRQLTMGHDDVWNSTGFAEDPGWTFLVVLAGNLQRADEYGAEFWEQWYDDGGGQPSADFVLGFVEGATELFDEVADKL